MWVHAHARWVPHTTPSSSSLVLNCFFEGQLLLKEYQVPCACGSQLGHSLLFLPSLPSSFIYLFFFYLFWLLTTIQISAVSSGLGIHLCGFCLSVHFRRVRFPRPCKHSSERCVPSSITGQERRLGRACKPSRAKGNTTCPTSDTP